MIKTKFVPLFLFLLIYIPFSVVAQKSIEGKIVDDAQELPIAYATVFLVNQQTSTIANKDGQFNFSLPSNAMNDTIIFSAVGFLPLKVPVSNALKISSFSLKQNKTAQTLNPVVIKYTKEDVSGAKLEKIGFFRGWNTNKYGGEIGRKIYVPHKEYQINKVRFKIYSPCDSTIVRLHIRSLEDDIPGEELLKKPVTIILKNASIADKTYDFDLTKMNLVLKNKYLFVGFEILNATNKNNSACSLAFVGSEAGAYIYKSTKEDTWNISNDSSIYLKMFFSYE